MKKFIVLFSLLLAASVEAAEVSASEKKEIMQMVTELVGPQENYDDASTTIEMPDFENEELDDASMADYYKDPELTAAEKEEQKKYEAEKKIRQKLTASERVAIFAYTGSYSEQINHELRRSAGKPGKLKTVIQNLDDALAKLPKYKGDVIRNANFPAEMVFKVGNVHNYYHYMSTSTTGVDFGFPWNITIKSKTGRFLDFISAVKGENEVLMPRGSKFKVISVDQLNHKMVWEQL